MTEMQLVRILACMAAFVVLIVSLDAYFNPLTSEEKTSENRNLSYDVCSGNMGHVFNPLLGVMFLTLILGGAFLAHKTKKFTTIFNESR